MESQNKKKKYIYIFNRVPPEKVVNILCNQSELIHTTPSLNYRHLQNLSRSLAKKKKVVGTIICQVWMVGKLNFDVCPFLCNHQMERGKNKTLSLNMNMCISVYYHHHNPSSVVSQCFSLVCVLFIFIMLRELEWQSAFVEFPFFFLSLGPQKPTHNIPPRESHNWCLICFCPSPNHTGMNS